MFLTHCPCHVVTNQLSQCHCVGPTAAVRLPGFYYPSPNAPIRLYLSGSPRATIAVRHSVSFQHSVRLSRFHYAGLIVAVELQHLNRPVPTIPVRLPRFDCSDTTVLVRLDWFDCPGSPTPVRLCHSDCSSVTTVFPVSRFHCPTPSEPIRLQQFDCHGLTVAVELYHSDCPAATVPM